MRNSVLGVSWRGAVVGDTVSEGDLLSTNSGSEVHMVMQDSGFMALRANSQLMVVNYKADGSDDDKGVFRLLTGSLLAKPRCTPRQAVPP